MGLLDGILGALGGGASGGSRGLAGSLLELLGGSQGGGLAGLVQSFQQQGLGKIVESWVGTGQNLPVTPGQIQQALGPKVQQLAQQHGMSADAVSQALAQLLPGVVDHLTPNGQIPQGGIDQALSALRGKLGL